MIMPGDKWKVRWDSYIMLVLCFVTLTVPYRLAFSEEDNTTWEVINYIIDISFVIDMIFCFNTALFEEDL